MQGLKNQVKRRSIFRYLKDQNCAFYLLQETYSELNDGSNHSRGVCILTNPKCAISVDEFHRDSYGSIVSINISLNKNQFSICNVYAPVKPTEQDNFVQRPNEFLLQNANVDTLILGGDWNFTFNVLIKRVVQDGNQQLS